MPASALLEISRLLHRPILLSSSLAVWPIRLPYYRGRAPRSLERGSKYAEFLKKVPLSLGPTIPYYLR